MEAKYTKGEWFVVGSFGRTKYVETRIGGGLIQEIASIGPTAEDGGCGEQQEANARLISAAPDLLEALQMIVDLNPPLPMGCIEAAEGAISKALGK